MPDAGVSNEEQLQKKLEAAIARIDALEREVDALKPSHFIHHRVVETIAEQIYTTMPGPKSSVSWQDLPEKNEARYFQFLDIALGVVLTLEHTGYRVLPDEAPIEMLNSLDSVKHVSRGVKEAWASLVLDVPTFHEYAEFLQTDQFDAATP